MTTNNLPRIIGITGRKFNGKDTLAEYLVKNYGYEQMMFAKPIKDMSKILFGFDDEQLYGSKKEVVDERWGVTPRDLFQFIGTEMFRKMMGKKILGLGENFWVKCLFEQVKSRLKENPDARIVISDVRFPNEIEIIKKLDSHLLVRVSRPSINCNIDVHESEIFIEKLEVDHEIINDKGVAEVCDKLKSLLESI